MMEAEQVDSVPRMHLLRTTVGHLQRSYPVSVKMGLVQAGLAMALSPCNPKSIARNCATFLGSVERPAGERAGLRGSAGNRMKLMK